MVEGKGYIKDLEKIVYHSKGNVDALFDFQKLSQSNVLELVNIVELKQAIEVARSSTVELRALHRFSFLKMFFAQVVSFSLTYMFFDRVSLFFDYLMSHRVISVYVMVAFVVAGLCNVLDICSIYNFWQRLVLFFSKKEAVGYFDDVDNKKDSVLVEFVSTFGFGADSGLMSSLDIVRAIKVRTGKEYSIEEVDSFMRLHGFVKDDNRMYLLSK